MSETIRRQFDYKPKWTVIALGVLFFCACTVVLWMIASNNDRGLSIGGIIELSPNGATIFYWIITGLSIAMLVAAVGGAVIRLTLRRRIAITDTCLIIPRSGWSSREVSVPFTDLVELSRSEVFGERSLKIVHRNGTFTVTASLLPRKTDFGEICRILSERIRDHIPRPRNMAN